jgi:hypothetical protein
MDISYSIGLGTIKLYENYISAGKTKKFIACSIYGYKNFLIKTDVSKNRNRNCL